MDRCVCVRVCVCACACSVCATCRRPWSFAADADSSRSALRALCGCGVLGAPCACPPACGADGGGLLRAGACANKQTNRSQRPAMRVRRGTAAGMALCAACCMVHGMTSFGLVCVRGCDSCGLEGTREYS